ncbi:MAG: hypothetical protein PHG25_02925 [Candidatus Pacebacteria bacterium]|nr:hypothetical protein [Candidatus Paceibacterota bacterium]
MASKKVTKAIKKSAVKTSKKEVTPKVADVEENEDEDADIASPKNKIVKPLEVDAVADILPEVDEKVVDEENPLLAVEDEESEDAISLDSEDLNPFGDKWEE